MKATRVVAVSIAALLLEAAYVPVGQQATAEASTAAVTYAVTTLADVVDQDGACSLREALAASVIAVTASNDCGAGAGEPDNLGGTPTQIVFRDGGRGTHLLASELVVAGGAHVLLDGAGQPGQPDVVLDGQARHRVLRAAGAMCGDNPSTTEVARTLLLRDLTVSHGTTAPELCPGGATNWLATVGGGVLAGLRTTLVADRVAFLDNSARGGGAAIATMRAAAVSDSTFAFNRVEQLVDGEAGWADAAVYVHNGSASVVGSTFFHNSTDWRARDLATAYSGVGDLLTSLAAHANVHVSPPGADGFSCHKHETTSGTTTGFDTDSAGSGSACTLLHNQALVAVDAQGSPLVLDADPRQAVANRGGFSDTVAFAPGAPSHNGVTAASLTCVSWLKGPDASATSPLREAVRQRDARGLPRSSGPCDAGSLERQGQSIDFSLPGEGAAVVGAALPAATATSGAAVAVTAGPIEVCTAAGAVVSLVGVGQCTATASQAGSALHEPATPVERVFAVSPAQVVPSLSFVDPPAHGLVGGTWTVTTTTDPEGLHVTTSVANGSQCTLDGTTVTFTGVGTCTVSAETTATSTHSSARKSVDVQVVLTPQGITFSPVPLTGAIGQSVPLTATGGPSGNTVTLTVPPPTKKGAKPVCALNTVGSAGASTSATLSYLNTGTCTVIATQAGDSGHESGAATLQVQVSKRSGRR